MKRNTKKNVRTSYDDYAIKHHEFEQKTLDSTTLYPTQIILILQIKILKANIVKHKNSSMRLNLKPLVGNRSKDLQLWAEFLFCRLFCLGAQFVKLLLSLVHHLGLLFPLLLKILYL
ncbi:hypothetical protein Hanom_Chr04g00342401 [Helianthus anomalus]